MEKIIKNQLLSFINKYNIISNCQDGFREYVSTSDALANVVETVVSLVNSNLQKLNNCAILSIDLCKAFDTFNSSILF